MAEKDQDTALREAARARGFRLVKSRRRKPGGDFGRYGLVGLDSGRECLGFGSDGLTATAEEVHAYLRGGEVASWKRSLIGVVDAPSPAAPPAPPKNPARSAASVPTKTSPAPAPKGKGTSKPRESKRPSTSLGTSGKGSGGPEPASATPQPLTIREATRRDAAMLAKLLGIPATTLAERLAAAIRAGEPPLVASRGEAVAGMAAWTIIATLDRGPLGRLTVLLVAEDARRQGLGTALLQGVEERLAEAGVTDVELLTGIDFDAPTAFLRRTGYTRRTNGYGKDLEG
jgi:GNAT superfamily N-acetyltransferase